jgi:hypothetical protein
MIWPSVLNDPYYRRSWASAIPILYCMTWWNVLYDPYYRRSWASAIPILYCMTWGNVLYDPMNCMTGEAGRAQSPYCIVWPDGMYYMTWWNVLYDLYDRRSWVSCWWASPTCLRLTHSPLRYSRSTFSILFKGTLARDFLASVFFIGFFYTGKYFEAERFWIPTFVLYSEVIRIFC